MHVLDDAHLFAHSAAINSAIPARISGDETGIPCNLDGPERQLDEDHKEGSELP